MSCSLADLLSLQLWVSKNTHQPFGPPTSNRFYVVGILISSFVLEMHRCLGQWRSSRSVDLSFAGRERCTLDRSYLRSKAMNGFADLVVILPVTEMATVVG